MSCAVFTSIYVDVYIRVLKKQKKKYTLYEIYIIIKKRSWHIIEFEKKESRRFEYTVSLVETQKK